MLSMIGAALLRHPLQSDLTAPKPFVLSNSVVVSQISLFRCTAMHRLDRASPLWVRRLCRRQDVVLSKVLIRRSDCSSMVHQQG